MLSEIIGLALYTLGVTILYLLGSAFDRDGI